MKIEVTKLLELEQKHPGVFHDFVSAGQMRGTYVEIDRELFDWLNKKHFEGFRLGTVVHTVLNPLVVTVDLLLGTKLKDCAGCAGRELKMNAASS